ncbi:hypothetical protein [Kitasatospora sp. GAS1066B]|uniref:hypothetical protein n=1 Tax=Kitasatospora sp. GAS1066B TaxID=3156271 RepID=UPI003512062F
MTDFTAWACAWVLFLLLAGLLACTIAQPGENAGRHRAGDRDLSPILIDLAGQRRATWDRDEPVQVRPLNTLPLCSALRRPLPVHVLRRTIPPQPPYVRGHAVHVEVQEGPRTLVTHPASIARVVPLWTAHHEQAQQARRQLVLAAASAGLPDPGYTYQGAQVLTGAVA